MEKGSSAELMRIKNESIDNDTGISFVGLLVILAQRRKVFIAVFIVFIIVGLIIAISSPRHYAYSTTIELADIGRDLIESTETVQAKLKESYIPYVIEKMMRENTGFIGRISVGVPRSTNVVIMTSQGEGSNAGHIRKMHLLVVDKLVNDHEPLVEAIRKSLAQDSTLVENQMKSIIDRVTDLKRKENNLLMTREKGKLKLEKLNAHLLEVSENNQRILRESKREDFPINILMTSREYDMYEQRVRLLEERLYTLIPRELEYLNTELTNVQRTWRGYQMSLQSINAELNTIRSTRAVFPAMKSVEPTSVGKKVIIIMSTILGFLAALLVIFIQELVSRVNRKMSHSSDSHN